MIELKGVLPSLISRDQSRFVKGKSITENVLAQEIISDIRIRGKLSNMVIKIDMAKGI